MTCVNALIRALSISTVPLKMVIEIKAFWALFCRYFSEYSEKYLFFPLFLAVHSLFIILGRNGHLSVHIVSCPPPIDNPVFTQPAGVNGAAVLHYAGFPHSHKWAKFARQSPSDDFNCTQTVAFTKRSGRAVNCNEQEVSCTSAPTLSTQESERASAPVLSMQENERASAPVFCVQILFPNYSSELLATLKLQSRSVFATLNSCSIKLLYLPPASGPH